MQTREVCAMSGNSYLLDTNALVALLQGNSKLLKSLQTAQWIGISIIAEIEFLAFPGLSCEDRQLFNRLLQRIDVIGLSPGQKELIELIIKLRQKYRVRLPDAIIAATAIQCGASLATADKQFKSIQELEIFDFT